jgi:hypothetical protein
MLALPWSDYAYCTVHSQGLAEFNPGQHQKKRKQALSV